MSATASRPSRLVRLVGSDSDFYYFVTPSWSTPGLEYDLSVCKRTGEIICSCPDACCRKKVGDILDETKPACKHVAGLFIAWRRLLNA